MFRRFRAKEFIMRYNEYKELHGQGRYEGLWKPLNPLNHSCVKTTIKNYAKNWDTQAMTLDRLAKNGNTISKDPTGLIEKFRNLKPVKLDLSKLDIDFGGDYLELCTRI